LPSGRDQFLWSPISTCLVACTSLSSLSSSLFWWLCLFFSEEPRPLSVLPTPVSLPHHRQRSSLFPPCHYVLPVPPKSPNLPYPLLPPTSSQPPYMHPYRGLPPPLWLSTLPYLARRFLGPFTGFWCPHLLFPRTKI